MNRTRSNGTLGTRIIIGGTHGNNLIAIAVGSIKDRTGNLRPALDRPGTGTIIGTISGMCIEHMEDSSSHIARKGETSQLIINNGNLIERILGVGDAVGQALHGLDEIAPLADDPAGAHDVVARAPGHGDVAGGLGLAVDGKRAEGLPLGVDLGGAVEDVVGGNVDARDPVLGAGAGEQRRPRRVGLPGDDAALGGLRFIHGRVGAAVDDGAVERPVVL